MGRYPHEGAEQHDQAEAQGEGREVAGADPEGEGHDRGRDVQGASYREAQDEGVEARHQQGELRRRQLHAQKPEVRALHPAVGAALQEGARDAPGAQADVKKNPQSHLYTSLGVITKSTIIEVNVAELGLVTQTGKVVWAKYAQVTNNPEMDGCINAVLPCKP